MSADDFGEADEIDTSYLEAIDALRRGAGDPKANRSAVTACLEGIRRQTRPLGREQQIFCQALIEAILQANEEVPKRRANAMLRATGLVGAQSPHELFIKFARDVHGFAIPFAMMMQQARDDGYTASDSEAPDYLDDLSARRLLRNNGIDWTN